MSIETILLFFVADLAICLVPGASTAVTASYAASGGMRASLGPITGIHIGNFIWYALSGLGLVALIAAAPNIYAAIRWFGVAYLLWMGARMILTNARSAELSQHSDIGFFNGFGSGLAVHMANPKVMLFYVSFLPQFIDPAISIPYQVIVFACITLVSESIGLLAYSFLASSASNQAAKRLGKNPVGYISGTILITIASGVAFSNFNA